MTADAGAVEALSAVDWAREPIVLYNGKFLWTKGVQMLLAAAPLVLERHPHTRFILVGFGSQRAWLEEIIDALDPGDLERLRVLLLRPREVDPEVDPDASRYLRGAAGSAGGRDLPRRIISRPRPGACANASSSPATSLTTA